MRTKCVAALGSLLIFVSHAVAAVETRQFDLRNPATLVVTILDENGSLIHSAHLYIFSKDKKSFYGSREAYGMTTLDLPPGSYRIYAGMTLKTDGVIDHYASPEANVSISTSEPTSVILSLQRAQDNEMVLSDTTRQKIDLDPELAKYLN